MVGGIGSGKSTAAAEFAALGCAVIDADAIGHGLLADPKVQQALRRRWGDAIFCDACVDRPALGRIVFDDPAELAALNEILHPRIREKISESIRTALAQTSVPAVVVDAAVLLEAGWDELCDCLIFVDAPSSLRRDRACEQRGWEEKVWAQREKSQNSLDKKRRLCDYSIDSSSTVSRLREQVRDMYLRLTHAADRPELAG